MNLMDFCYFGIEDITSFSRVVSWVVGSVFEISFVIWVLNITFSFFKKIILHFGGVR